MKTLQEYTDEKINVLFAKYNGFFAFSTDQFQKAKKEKVKYVNRNGGLYHEAGKEKEFDIEYQQIIKESIEQDLKENGKEAIIERELCNYECYYTREIDDAVQALKVYGIKENEVLRVFQETACNYND